MTTIAQHDQHLRKAGLPTVETLTRRILSVFDRASKSDIEAGAVWYPNAGTFAASLAGRHDIDFERAACLLSALSPRTSWDRNLAGAVAFLEGGREAAAALGCIGTNLDRAERVLDLDDPFDAFGPGAPKTAAFARNIAGDTEGVTVDVWACRVANVDEGLLPRKGVYAAIALAYQRAARRRGVEPTTMQATTWVVARDGRAS